MFIPQISLLLACLGLRIQASDYDAAVGVIQSYIKSLNDVGSQSLCEGYTCCNISATETCSIRSMVKDETTLVLPGGETRCIFSTSTPFAFQVIPGDSDKLLFYFQGGGACWDKISTAGQLCLTDSKPQSPVGVFDRNNKDNKFASHTIVHVLYCSGDVHGGDTVRPYKDSAGVPVTQKGLANAQSALDWVVKEQQGGGLASAFSEIVVMGCSAGSVGAQLWGQELLNRLVWNTAAVIPDSYAGLFPPGTSGPLIRGFGFCNSGFLSPDLMKSCLLGTLTLEDIDMEAIAATPTVPYAFIQSKVDYVQQSFYIAVGVTSRADQPFTYPAKFYGDVSELFAAYNTSPNFLAYLVDGPKHCYTNSDFYYTTNAMGPDGGNGETSKLTMSQWAGQWPLVKGRQAFTVCEGDITTSPNTTATVNTGKNGSPDYHNTYCDERVMPKTFTQA